MPNPSLLRVFVYGTLKRGHWNHEEYCGGALAREDTTVIGRLHIRHTGTPILELPRAGVLATGSGDALADVALQHRIARDLPSPPLLDADPQPPFVRVRGEVYTFTDAAGRLPRLDALEDYCPAGERESLYDRVLTTTGRGGNVAWVYVIPSHRSPADYHEAKKPEWWDPLVEMSDDQWRRRFGDVPRR